MKKITAGILFILLTGLVTYAFAQTVTSDLTGLGMNPELAEYIATRLPGGTALDNSSYLQSNNQAGSGKLSLIRGTTGDDTQVNADAGDVIKFSVANTPIAVIGDLDATGFQGMAVVGTATVGGSLSVTGVINATADINASGNTVYAASKGPALAAGVVVTPVANATTTPITSMVQRVSIIATAAPTANYIALPATPVAGAEYLLANRSANPVLIYPGGASSLTNGASFSCAASKLCRCVAIGAAELSCQ